jgi:hypothetical protein
LIAPIRHHPFRFQPKLHEKPRLSLNMVRRWKVEVKRYCGVSDAGTADSATTAVGSYGLPSRTNRNKIIARHGDPEVGAIPLMKPNEISF